MNAITTAEPKRQSLITTMAGKYQMDPDQFGKTVRATVMPERHTNEQFAALMLVANEYGLNPVVKEIYAFPAKGGGIVPVVSIDGWVNLVNSHPKCDGFEFEMEHDDAGNLVSCTCRMYRKDRSRPVAVTEYLSECKRQTDPWKMEHRMLRHKAMIQAARYAFGFSGIYDEDEGAKIADMKDMSPPAPPKPPAPPTAQVSPPEPPDEDDAGETVDAETGEITEAGESEAEAAAPDDEALEPAASDDFVNPDDVIEDAEGRFAAVSDEAAHAELCSEFEPYLESLFPPDADRLKAIMDKHLDRVLVGQHPLNGG